MRFRLASFALAALLSVLVARPALAARAHSGSLRLEQRMLRIVNHDRHLNGLGALHLDPALTHVALGHSLDMATHNYFAHNTPSGASPFDRIAADGIGYHVAGENLGWDNVGSRTDMLHAIEVAMLHSPEHRANLLRSSFTNVGIGIAIVGKQLYVTEDFTG